ncbi:hypothetical protein ACEQ8H_004797 [Pleosporales sp. CAS-2024a]
MASNEVRNAKLRAKLAFDYEHMPMPAVPSLIDLHLQHIAPPASPYPQTYPPHFGPKHPSSNEPSIPKDLDVTGLTFEQYKNMNLDFATQHELIGRIRDEVPLIDRDEIDSLLLADAGRQLRNGIFNVLKMMHVNPKAVKSMLDDQFRCFYGPDVNEETNAALEAPLIYREPAEDHVIKDQNAVPTAVDAREVADTFPVANTTEITDATRTRSAISEGRTTPLAHGAKKARLSSPEPMTSYQPTIKEQTPKMMEPRGDLLNLGESERRSVSVARDSIRETSTFSTRSRTARQNPRPVASVKKEKGAPLSLAFKQLRAYKGVCTRKNKMCCIATLRSKAVSDKWTELTEENER